MKTVLCLTLLTTSLNAFAQGDRSHGGGSHSCPGRAYQETYDLYEGEKRYNLTYTFNQSLSEQDYLNIAIKNIANTNVSLASRVQEAIKKVNYRFKKNISLEKIQDANFLLTDQGCKYEQLANWDDMTGIVLVNEDLYLRLNHLHKAALRLHEAVYYLARTQLDHKNSDLTRRFVASAFANIPEKNWLSAFERSSDIKPSTVKTNISMQDHVSVLVNLGDIRLSELADYTTQVQVTIPEIAKIYERSKEDFAEWDRLQKALSKDPGSYKILGRMKTLLQKIEKNYGFPDFQSMGSYSMTQNAGQCSGCLMELPVGHLINITHLETYVTVTVFKGDQIIETITERVFIKIPVAGNFNGWLRLTFTTTNTSVN